MWASALVVPMGKAGLAHSGLCAVCVQSLSHVQLCATPWTVALHVPLSMGFSRQEYWSGLLFPFPENLPNPEIKPASPASAALAGRFFTTEPPGKSTPNSRGILFVLDDSVLPLLLPL